MKSNLRLKHFIKTRGVTQRFIAGQIGMKPTALNAVLNGHAELKVDTLIAICNAIGVSPAVFFNFKVQENGKATA